MSLKIELCDYPPDDALRIVSEYLSKTRTNPEVFDGIQAFERTGELPDGFEVLFLELCTKTQVLTDECIAAHGRIVIGSEPPALFVGGNASFLLGSRCCRDVAPQPCGRCHHREDLTGQQGQRHAR